MGVQRITLDIDRSLWKQVGIEAAKNDTTRRGVVEVALKEMLDKEEK